MNFENKTKQLIYEQALKLFQEKSFQEVTINDICKASAIAKHTFYYHFNSKDDLLEKFYAIPCKMSLTDLSEILNSESYVEQLWLLSKPMIDFLINTDADMIKQMFIKNLQSDIGTFHASGEHKQIITMQMDIIKKGQSNEQFLNKTEPLALSIIFRHTILSTAISRIIKKLDNNSEDYIRYLFENLFNVAPKYRKMQNYKPLDF